MEKITIGLSQLELKLADKDRRFIVDLELAGTVQAEVGYFWRPEVTDKDLPHEPVVVDLAYVKVMHSIVYEARALQLVIPPGTNLSSLLSQSDLDIIKDTIIKAHQ